MNFRHVLPVSILLLAGGAAIAAGTVADSADQIEPLATGASVPRVALQAADGADTTLAAVLDGQPSVLIFYRGGW
jgi:cytochrome oxidase Cu insertion factor (SCO1/SenC/PrrC family)